LSQAQNHSVCTRARRCWRTRPVSAVDAGCSLIIWDLITDKKIKLHNHAASIQDLCFLSHDDR
jgi:hypothetical protein